MFFRRLYHFCFAIEFRANFNYKNKPYKDFIEKENVGRYRRKNIELIAGEMGHWLEI